MMGEVSSAVTDVERMVAAVPRTVAAALSRKAYYFVPLTLNLDEDTMIADRYDVSWPTAQFAIATTHWATRSVSSSRPG